MPKIRTVEIAKLPAGKIRFSETQPAIKERIDSARTQGKLTNPPQEFSNEGDLQVVKTTTIWNNKSDYDEFIAWYSERYVALHKEYNLANGITITRTITQE